MECWLGFLLYVFECLEQFHIAQLLDKRMKMHLLYRNVRTWQSVASDGDILH